MEKKWSLFLKCTKKAHQWVSWKCFSSFIFLVCPNVILSDPLKQDVLISSFVRLQDSLQLQILPNEEKKKILKVIWL